MLTAEQEKLFWAKVRKGGDNDCWPWTAATNPSGYGRFGVNRRLHGAHRVSYRLAGREIPDGLVIDHTCRNRLCVNPRHLRAVDRFTNVHENSVALGHLHAIKTHCPQGHPYSGDNLIIQASGRRACRECRNTQQRARRLGPARGESRK